MHTYMQSIFHNASDYSYEFSMYTRICMEVWEPLLYMRLFLICLT